MSVVGTRVSEVGVGGHRGGRDGLERTGDQGGPDVRFGKMALFEENGWSADEGEDVDRARAVIRLDEGPAERLPEGVGHLGGLHAQAGATARTTVLAIWVDGPDDHGGYVRIGIRAGDGVAETEVGREFLVVGSGDYGHTKRTGADLDEGNTSRNGC